MSAVTSKERNMLMITLVLVLYAFAFFFYKKQTQNWKKQKRIYESAGEKFAMERDLIAAKQEWDDKYRDMRALMPVFPYDQDVDTYWLNLMDTVATRSKLAISRRQTGKEEEVGDVYELPIVCNNWEGTLEALVNFLYGLRQQGAMLDVRQLYVRPGASPGYLKGTFTLYCAYMRGEVVEVEDPQPAVGTQEADAGNADSVVDKSAEMPAVEIPEVEETVETPSAEPAPEEEINEEDAVKEALKVLGQ